MNFQTYLQSTAQDHEGCDSHFAESWNRTDNDFEILNLFILEILKFIDVNYYVQEKRFD